jgi:hypothetical protein
VKVQTEGEKPQAYIQVKAKYDKGRPAKVVSDHLAGADESW